MSKLDDFPSLKDWYLKNHGVHPTFTEDPVEHTVSQFCLALTLSSRESSIIWQNALSILLDGSNNLLADFGEMERFLEYSGAPLTQIISNWGYESFEIGMEEEFFLLMQKAAAKTQLVSFYFLAAWSAFNQDDYDACLKLCDSVSTLYAPVLTLKGQALLESGNPSASVHVLEDAVSVDPQEALAWFQLAKSYWLLKKYQQAFDALQSCLKFTGRNPEISLFMSIVALEAPFSISWHEKAWEEMLPFIVHYRANEEFVERLVQLAINANRLDWMELATNEVDWESLKQAFVPNKKLGPILRSLGERQWFELATKILDQMI